MEGTQKKQLFDNRLWIVFLAAFAVLFSVLFNQWGHVEYADQIVFFLAQIAFVLIPGMALVLLIGPPKDRVCLIVLSFLAGMGVTIGEYFLFYALGLQDCLVVPLAAVSALAVLAIWKKRERLQKTHLDHTSAWAVSALLAGMLLLVLFTACSLYNTPDLTGAPVYLYQDLAWNAGNVTAVANGMPVMDVHIDGLSFGYHFLANVYLAVFQNVLGLSSYTLFLRMLAVIQVLAYAGGLYLLFSRLFKNRWAAAGAAAVAAFVGNTVLQHMMWYAYATPLGLGFALAAAYCFFGYMKRMGTAKWTDGSFLLFLIFLALATGTKAPFAGGVLAGAGIVILMQLFRRKNVKNMLCAGVATLAVFGAVYVSLVYDTHAFNGLQFAFASGMWMAEPAYYTAALAALGTALPVAAIKLLTYPIYMVLNYPTIVAAVVLLIVSLVRHRGKHTKWKAFLLSGILAGFVMTSVTYQPGMSNLFFMEGVIPLSVFALFLVALDFCAAPSAKRAGRIAVSCVVALALAWSVCGTLASPAGSLKTSAAWIGARAGNGVAAPPYDSITPGEYEGMLWLKENTPNDAVFASDRQYFTDVGDLNNARYYYYTAFSERQCYLEGFNYVSTREADFEEIIDKRVTLLQEVYENDGQAVKRLAGEGVSYLTVSSLLHPDFVLDENLGEIVFRNEAITIYRLHEV